MTSSTKWIIGLSFLFASSLQAFIWYAAFVNAGSGSALNFVSFAGTLISIILAVLAIGYTYGESISQKGKGDSLASQISALTEVASNMRTQVDALAEVSNIKSELENVAIRIENGFIETKQTVSDVSQEVSKVGQKFDSMNMVRTEPFSVSHLDKREVARSILAARTPFMEISVLITVYLIDVKKIGLDPVAIKANIYKLVDELESEEHKDLLMHEVRPLFLGGVLAMRSALDGFGLIGSGPARRAKKGSVPRITAFVDSALKEEISKSVLDKPMPSGPFYKVLRDHVVTELKHSGWKV